MFEESQTPGNQQKNKTGPKELQLDEEELIKLAKMGCTVQEMADWFECSKDVLERRYMPMIKKHQTQLKQTLRRAMIRNALENNSVPIQIWLSKQFLGMKEPRQEIDFTNGVDQISFTDDQP